jgi:transcriptional regulator with XRE-family HTH domain
MMPMSKIQAARLAKGWTQKKLAERAEVSRRTLEDYEQGRCQPGAANLKKLAKALGCKMEDLI